MAINKRASSWISGLECQCVVNSQSGRVTNVSCSSVSRFAVLKNYCVQKILSSGLPSSPRFIRLTNNYGVINMVETLLGNRRYDKVYIGLIGEKQC